MVTIGGRGSRLTNEYIIIIIIIIIIRSLKDVFLFQAGDIIAGIIERISDSGGSYKSLNKVQQCKSVKSLTKEGVAVM